MDFNKVVDISKLNKLDPEKGRLLISEPFLDDDYFKRSVVLLCEHNEEGSFGFVLNNYINIKIEEVVDDFPGITNRISIGGPVQTNNLYYIHTMGEKLSGSIHIAENLWMGGNFDVLKVIMEAEDYQEHAIRFFVGYSGWEAKQLEGELERNSWIVADAKVEDVMHTDQDKLWAKVLKSMGKDYAILANFPEDPSLN